MTGPLEKMLRETEALRLKGSSITLVRDGEGRFQCSYQKDRKPSFAVHVANDPVEAIAGALEGLDGIRAVRGPTPLEQVIAAAEPDLDDLQNSKPHMTYWYHPESDSVWAEMSDKIDWDNMDVALSCQITEEEYQQRLARTAEPDLDDLL